LLVHIRFMNVVTVKLPLISYIKIKQGRVKR
jgi:hypothetical protein